MSDLTFNCAGMARRDFIQLGIRGVVGLGLTDILRLRARAAEKGGKPQEVRCILIWMDGGPSHYETFDPKPDAPIEIRGELKPIKTKVPGIQFCESIPKLAAVADKLTVVRSICHKDPNHGGGAAYILDRAPPSVPGGLR